MSINLIKQKTVIYGALFDFYWGFEFLPLAMTNLKTYDRYEHRRKQMEGERIFLLFSINLDGKYNVESNLHEVQCIILKWTTLSTRDKMYFPPNEKVSVRVVCETMSNVYYKNARTNDISKSKTL